MFVKQTRILVFCLFLGLSLGLKLHIPIRPNAHIQELQMESRELAATHSGASDKCFLTYSPILASITKEFEINYGACISAKDNSTALVNAKYSADREILLRSASIGCSYPNTNCQVWTFEQQNLDTVVSRLECASINSGESSKTFYGISANATEIVVKIKEEYRVLENLMEICTNDANRNYVEDTTYTYERLNDCLKYGIDEIPETTTRSTKVSSKKLKLRLLAMFSRSSLLAVILAFGLVSGLSINLKLNASKLKLPTNKKILGLQQQTEMLAARDPSSSKSCFDYYNPILNGLPAQLELDYDNCERDYETGNELVIKAWNSTLYGIQAAGDRGCGTFFDCSSIVDYVEAFECFANVGAEQSKTMYQVSANATEAAANIKIHLQTLNTQRESCKNLADRDYVEGTASTYEGLTSCLSGAPIPQETTVTTTTTTTTPDYWTTGK
nr:uncharacterized protein LOC108065220 [Drosophila takahashii]